MNVLMLGGAAVGKTTLMVSTYGMMRERNLQGFHVICQNRDAHRELINAYRAFRREGRYPPRTDRMKSYICDFFSGQEFIINFKITDINGESSRNCDPKELRDQIRTADALMLFFDGFRLSRGQNMDDVLLDLMPLVNMYFDSGIKKRLLMPVFTKMDRVDDPAAAYRRKIMPFFRPMADMASRNQNLDFAAAPVGCAPSRLINLDFALVSLIRFGYAMKVKDFREELSVKQRDTRGQYPYGFGVLSGISGALGRNAAKKGEFDLESEVRYHETVMLPKLREIDRFCLRYRLFSRYAEYASGDPFNPF